jgi:hypothetical protein
MRMGKSEDIRGAVEAELGFDPLVDATGITVKNINGDVALNGTVPSHPHYLEAAAAQRHSFAQEVRPFRSRQQGESLMGLLLVSK